MEEDNMYINDGSYFNGMAVPQEQKQDSEKEKIEVVNELPVIQTAINFLQERIDFYATPFAYTDDAFTNPDVFMYTMAGYKIAIENLTQDKEALELLLKEYK